MMAKCPHCGVFEGDNHHSLCPFLQRKRDSAMHRHNGADYARANDCPHCWREASDIQSKVIESLRAQLADAQRDLASCRATLSAIVERVRPLMPIALAALENNDE